MEVFVREYATRSLTTHLNKVVSAPRTSFLLHGYSDGSNSYNYNTNSNGNNNEDTDDNDNSRHNDTEPSVNSNLYFIAPPQLLLNASSVYNEDIAQNDTAASMFLLASQAASSTISSTTSTLGVDEVAIHPLSDFSATDGSMNSSIYEGLKDYMNFSCDGESLSDGLVNSTGGEFAEEDDSPLSSVYFKTTVYLLYIPIFVFALLGNGTVCYIVQSTPRMRTVTNYFIANLAVGDILMSLFCVPFSFVSIFILGYWPFGIALCYLVNYSQAVSVLVSAYTLVAISIDRYIAIMWPLRPRITKRYAKFIIAGVWGIALLTAFPIPIVSKLTQPDIWHKQCNRYICREEWPTNEQYYYYTLALFTLQFVVPLVVLIFTYTRIALAVWGKRPPGEAENSRDQRMARSKRKIKTANSYSARRKRAKLPHLMFDAKHPLASSIIGCLHWKKF